MSESSGGDDGSDDVALERLRLSPPPPPPPPLCALRAHGGDVQAAVLSPCGTLLYSGDSEGYLRIWDVEDRRTVFSLKLHPPEGGVLGLSLPRSSSPSSPSSRGRELLSQGREGTLKLWRLSDSGREIVDGGDAPRRCSPGASPPPPPPPPPLPPPRPLRTTATGSKGFCVLSAVEEAEGSGRLLAAVASEDAAGVLVFDARRGELLCELSEAEAAAAAAPASSSREGGGAQGAAQQQQQQQQQQQGKSRGMAMAVSLFFVGLSGALHALVGYEDGSVVLWRCLEGAGGKGKRNGNGCGGSDVDDGGRAAAAASPPPRALSSLRIHFDAVTAVGTASQDFTGKTGPLRFFSGGADSVLASYLVEIATPSPFPSPCPSPSPSLSLSPGPAAKLPARGVGALAVLQRSEGGGTLVVAGGWDGAARLLALREGESREERGRGESDETLPPSSPRALSLEPLGELEHHVAPIAALTFDASGELLASGGRDGSVALWGLGALV